MSEEHSEYLPQILVADDDPAILKLVKTVAESEGFAVITARDGQEAVKILFSGELFVAAIFDIKMPHIQGTELAKYMQADFRSRNIPVIIITAEESSALMAESYSSGAAAFLPKPFSISQLRTMLRTFVPKNYQHIVNN